MRIVKTTLFLFLSFQLFAQNGIVKGTLTDALSNEPIGFANVLVMGTDAGGVTDIDGKYEIAGIKPGLYDIRASYVGFEEQTIYEIQVSSAKPAIVNFKMEENGTDLEEVVVKASPFRKTEESPVSLRTIGVAEIQRNPGGNRDISKVIQTLPGVTSGGNFRNDLIIRGGAPNENRFYLDDVEVPNINHFATQGSSGGPVGLINVNFIKEVDFYSGAFPANRGNALSSVLNFRQADGRDDRIGGTFMMGSSDIGATIEGPLSDKTTFLFSARRSYLQFLFEAIGLPFLPTYNDFQTKIKYKIDQKNEIYFIGLGAIDQFKLNLDANETEEQQFLLNNLPVSPQWNYTNGLVYKHYDKNGYWTVVLSRNMLNNESKKYFQNDDSSEDNLILDYKSQEIENKLRVENTTRLNSYKLNYGMSYEFAKYNNSTFNKIFTSNGPQTIDFASDFNLSKYAIFAQGSNKFLNERLVMSLGFRIDGNFFNANMIDPLDQFSPRFSLAYAITEQFSFNFNTGRYFQLPPYTIMGYREGDKLVNKANGISFIRNDQLVAGFEYNTASSSKISLEGYYKRYANYPFLTRDQINLANLGSDFGIIGNEPALSTGKGETYGLEFLFQQRLFRGFYGIGSYTLGFSEFEDRNEELIPSAWDARHIVNITAGKKLGKNWEVGVNWRFQTGLPFTPYSSDSDLVLNWDVNGRGIFDYNLLNTLRTGNINSFDIRVDKKWFFKKWSLNVYLDVENVNGNAVGFPQLILDRPLDDEMMPIGGGVIANPNAPVTNQRYLLKEINDATGNALPSIGLMIEI